ncbi:FMN-binding protein [Aeromicrobium sp. Root236]|uniref:FMN-binding protein n=1 Tax=Aeromicrobium sp. Root236 TaxID=1736498 RepID=UPI0006F6C931|nr:FMN-binding protein [Aeromicrobium sp. Root236]KRC65923.1 FMN-binding protein [Aeromicrobium sp. Root236]
MKRIVLWFLSTLTTVVLLFGYHTSTAGPAATSVLAPPTAGSSASNDSTSSSDASSTDGAKTYTGPSTDTQWGPVQVAITVANGKITEVTVPVYPNGNGRDEEINAYALPILTKATLESQDGNVDMISGATVTSRGYATSLQGALDKAGL